MAALFGFAAPTQAQTYLFTESSTTPTRYGKMTAVTDAYSSLKIVQFNSLTSVQQNGIVRVNWSENPCGAAAFRMTNVDFTDNDNFLWYGYLVTQDSMECLDGYLQVGSTGGKKYGSMRIGSSMYSIEDLTGGLQVLAKAPTYAQPQVCPTVAPPDTSRRDTIRERGANCDIRVLTLYTSRVAATIVDPMTFAMSNFAKTNQVSVFK